MLVAVRAGDGAAFTLQQADLKDVTTLNELRFNLLGPLLQIPPECLICLNEQGAQLDESGVAGLAALAETLGDPQSATSTKRRATSQHDDGHGQSDEHRIYVFDRDHLENDPDEVAKALLITDDDALREPPLAPEDSLESHVHLSMHNLETQQALIQSISLQHSSLQLAFSNLERVLATSTSARERFENEASQNFEAWRGLLNGWQPAMNAVNHVRVLPGLVGKTHARKSSIDGHSHSTHKDKKRYLGDYVNYDKMLAVRDGCAQVLETLESQRSRLYGSIDEVSQAVETLQAEFAATTHDLEDLGLCSQDADKGHERVIELVRAGEEKLSYFDSEHRARIHFLVERKNAMTRYLVHTMQRISIVQSDIAPLATLQGELEHDMRTRTDNFKHLARLENLVPAYVATVAEVVRRRLFAELLNERNEQYLIVAQDVSGRERERRSLYRLKYGGQLPWEVKGIGALADEPDSYIGIETRDRADELPQLVRADLQEIRDEIAALQFEADAKFSLPEGPIDMGIRVCDAALTELDQLASVFKASSGGPDDTLSQMEDLRTIAKAAHDRAEGLVQELESERSARAEEAARLSSRNDELSTRQEREAQELDELRRQLERARTEVAKARSEREQEQETHQRAITQLVAQHEKALAYSESTGQDYARQLKDVASRLSEVQVENARVSGETAKAKSLVQDLQAAVESAQSLQRNASAQLAEKERELRDLRGEAELERAVLEKEIAESRAALSKLDADVCTVKNRNNTLEDIAAGLRSQVARLEKTLVEKEAASHSLRDSFQDAQFAREAELRQVKAEAEEMASLARKALRVAGMRKIEAKRVAEVLSTMPTRAEETTTDDKAQAASVSTHKADTDSEPDFDAADLKDLLEHVSDYDVQDLTEAVRGKIEHLTAAIKKYIKEARGYRDRAQKVTASGVDKIAFRNFTKGDLALFLPTRNSEVPVWAAFNVSFPHHFLAATGAVAEQMKVREWIVARITSITEKVVDPKVPSSEPFMLASGTKYYLLEAEPWSSRDARRRSSSDKTRAVSGAVKSRSKSAKLIAKGESDEGPDDSVRGELGREAGDSIVREAQSATTRAEQSWAGPSVESIPEDPIPTSKEDVSRSTSLSGPSALSRSLAAARSRTSSPVPTSDPFVSSNPFDSVPEPANVDVGSDVMFNAANGSSIEEIGKDARKDTSAAAAFLPTSGRKPGSSYAESSTSSSGPRYVRSSQTSTSTQKAARGVPIASPRADRSGTARSVSSSLPRSASSASSILSTLMYRNAGLSNGGLGGALPPSSSVHLDTSPAVAEAQRSFVGGSPGDVSGVGHQPLDTLPAGSPPSSSSSGRPSSGVQANSRTSVVMDALAGRRRSTLGPPDMASVSTGSEGAVEAEIKKLLQR
ncbi:hypothetical protein ACM66B_003804 [Microbotryomycetes sp. NB124-2]